MDDESKATDKDMEVDEEEEREDEQSNSMEVETGDEEDDAEVGDGDVDSKVEDGDEADNDENEEEIEDSEEDEDEDGEGEGDDDDEEEENVDKTAEADPGKSPYKKRETYHVPKIFQDAVTVLIPLDVTADLKIAIQKTRAKRIKSIYKRFPALQSMAKKQPQLDDVDIDDPMTGEDDDENGKEKEKIKVTSKKKKLGHIPQPDQFGSVLDYLEAKYVKGVMLEDNDDEGPGLDDKSEGQGSVYSKDSFLDDTDLQRDVAEQVMASTTMTKVELEQQDGDFFVNVGNLELENDDYGDNYDPLQDKENAKAPKKKRKNSTTSAGSALSKNLTTPPKKKKKTASPKAEEPTSAKSKKSAASATSAKSKKSSATPKDDKEPSERSLLQKEVKKMKARVDNIYKKGVAMIKKLTDEELPKRKTKLKVALTCPPNKKPGDDITFSNPHNPGQRLRVKVPKDSYPGSTFKVTVPVKLPEEDEGKDRNKFPREFQDVLDDFARAYDDWLEAKHALDPEFNVWKERQNKFDKFEKEFPSNLVTPVDAAYLKQALRRFRQNKAKRDKTKAAASTAKLKDTKTVKKEPIEQKKKEDTMDEKPVAKTRTVHIPGMGNEYPTKIWAEDDFE